MAGLAEDSSKRRTEESQDSVRPIVFQSCPVCRAASAVEERLLSAVHGQSDVCAAGRPALTEQRRPSYDGRRIQSIRALVCFRFSVELRRAAVGRRASTARRVHSKPRQDHTRFAAVRRRRYDV